MEVVVVNYVSNPFTKIPKLPIDPTTYRRPRNKQAVDTVMQYVTPEEWAELATSVNASIRKHHQCNSIATLIFIATGFLLFCPMCYVAVMLRSRVNKEMATLSVTQKLSERGIELYWVPNGDLGNTGGMTVTISPQAKPLLPGVPATPQTEVPIQIEMSR